MSRFRLVLLSLVAVLALGAITAVSASAHEFKVVGGALPEEISGSSGTSLLEGEVGGVKVAIECTEDLSSGTLEAGGKSKGKIEFVRCVMLETKPGEVKVLTCKVKTPIEFEFVDELVNGNGYGPEDEFSPTAAHKKLFVEITVTGCALEGKYKAETTEEGKGVDCALPDVAAAKVFHEIICVSTGDTRLRFGGNKASYSSVDLVRTKSGKEWYAE
jgi:hypothetical protein